MWLRVFYYEAFALLRALMCFAVLFSFVITSLGEERTGIYLFGAAGVVLILSCLLLRCISY